MKKRRGWILILCLLLPLMMLSGCESVTKRANHQDTWSRIERRHKVIIGVDDSFVPMGFRQKNGKLVGYDVDLARAVFKQYGIKADFQTIDWSMKETELKNGTIDLLWNGYSVTPQRQKKVAFSRVYLLNKQILVTKKSDHINNFQEMTGKTLGVQNGSTGMTMLDEYPRLLKDRIKDHKPVLYDTFPNAFIDLNANRIQGILMDEVYADYYIQHQPDRNAYATYSSSKMPADKFAVGMRKGDRTLRQKVNQGLGRLQKNGELRKINEKWFGKDSNYLGPNN
ncbi:ABC transporter, substrate-binding protein, family 3 [Limosilactobacillus coleohominis 101-4-CHN]|uniref:ABC transporter, substrate-binding protein, family 3 n=1 Tax=Limosilactobacillus coleohominis 101-4-CHN TaxID=575594 RepID=C7XWL5_9LACO|nr:amino acid ABC transporter substrate-binding protein [Limosilactobacillus coleohominis]EEU30013.1 ABC transporter, substrate-binding protein, family 3 [Limosilactobacillus coleohominis 101-4-CHN]